MVVLLGTLRPQEEWLEGQSVAHVGTRRGWARAALGLALWGCADLLGIPSEPRLVDEVPEPAASPPPDSLAPGPTAAPGAGPRSAAAADGMQQVTGLSPGPSNNSPQTQLGASSDAGVVPPGDAGSSPDCPAGSTAVLPMDIVLILDNSGSMQAGTASVERGLGAWAALLGAGGLDYRLILLSRHRTLERTESGAASTSICVARPLSGLASCPSPEPVLAERFCCRPPMPICELDVLPDTSHLGEALTRISPGV